MSTRPRELARRRAHDWTRFAPPRPLGDAWHVPPEWLEPLEGELGAAARRALSRFVLGGLHSAAAHAERRFAASARSHGGALSGAARALASEETQHAGAFAAFAEIAGGGLLPDRTLVLRPSPGGACGEALLFGRLLVTEEILDVIDLELAADTRLPEAIRRLHAAHHGDEARHLAFGRAALRGLVDACAPPERPLVRAELEAAAEAAWHAALPVEAFRRAGLPHPSAARRACWEGAAWTRLRERARLERLASLRRRGVLPEAAR